MKRKRKQDKQVKTYINRVLTFLHSQDKEWLVDGVIKGCELVENVYEYLNKLALTDDFLLDLDQNSLLGLADLAELGRILQRMADEVCEK